MKPNYKNYNRTHQPLANNRTHQPLAKTLIPIPNFWDISNIILRSKPSPSIITQESMFDGSINVIRSKNLTFGYRIGGKPLRTIHGSFLALKIESCTIMMFLGFIYYLSRDCHVVAAQSRYSDPCLAGLIPP